MRWIAVLGGIALLAGCLEPKTVDCHDGSFCPAGLKCAMQGYCGEPALVDACSARLTSFEDCNNNAGTCLYGICGACDADRAGCRFEGWTPMRSGPQPLHAISVPELGRAIVGGYQGVIVEYDGVSWEATQIPNTNDKTIKGVWRDFAVVDDGRILQRGSDGAWVEVARAVVSLSAISGTGPADVIAVGTGATVMRLTDGAWQTQMAPGGLLRGVWAADADNIFIVGDGGLVYRSQGNGWVTSRAFGTGPDLHAVWGSSPNDVYAVGDASGSSTIVHFNGTGWTSETVSGSPANLYAVWGTSATNVFAVGASGKVFRKTNNAWEVMDSGVIQDLRGVGGSAPDDVIAVGDAGTVIRYTGR